MTMNDQSALEKAIHDFTIVTYIGVATIVIGVIVAAFLSGGARVFLACFAFGSGGLMLWVGVREQRKGRKMLALLEQKSREASHEGD